MLFFIFKNTNNLQAKMRQCNFCKHPGLDFCIHCHPVVSGVRRRGVFVPGGDGAGPDPKPGPHRVREAAGRGQRRHPGRRQEQRLHLHLLPPSPSTPSCQQALEWAAHMCDIVLTLGKEQRTQVRAGYRRHWSMLEMLVKPPIWAKACQLWLEAASRLPKPLRQMQTMQVRY